MVGKRLKEVRVLRHSRAVSLKPAFRAMLGITKEKMVVPGGAWRGPTGEFAQQWVNAWQDQAIDC